MVVRGWITRLKTLGVRRWVAKTVGVGGVLALVAGLGIGVTYVNRGLPRWWSKASGPVVYTTTQIPMSNSEIINPLRGYFRWRGSETVDREVVPSQDEYERYVWRDLETSPGVYNFGVIDKAIADAASQGRKYWFSVRALRGNGGTYAGINVPDYMEPYGWWYDSNNSGAIEKTSDTFIPDWNHQYFLERAASLIGALGQRYDEDPRVSMVEIRVYGLYGEWHMYGIDYNKAPVKDSAYCSQSICVNQKPIKPDGTTATSPGSATLRRIVDMHVSAFPNKQLIILVGGKDNADAIQYALSRSQTTNPRVSFSIGLRNDCLGLIEYGSSGLYYEHFRDMLTNPQWTANTYTNNAPESLGQNRWKYAPVIAEYCSMFPGMKETKNGTNKPIFQVAQQQVLDYHVALVGNGNFEAPFSGFSAQEQSDAILAGKLAGYRIVLDSLSVPATLTPGQQFLITTKWANVGVAPPYESWNVVFQLRSGSNVVWQGTSAFKPQGFLPTGSDVVTIDDTYSLPANVSNGVYSMSVVVQDPNGARKPLALAVSGRASDGSYSLGPVTISTPSPTPTVSPAPTLTPAPVGTNAIYVATNGSDTTGDGSVGKPFLTMNKAQNYVVPGSTVYLRGGTYHSQAYITTGSGSASGPVTYTPYPGEVVVIDGTGVSVVDPQALIRLYGVSYVNVVGFEVSNSSGRGISADHTNNVIIQDNKVHDTQYRAIGADGADIIIDRNEVYNGSMSNRNNVAFPSGGWPAVLSTSAKKDGSASQNITISNNYVHDSWGEGIDTMSLDGGRITGNRVRDTFSIAIYMDNARNVTVDGNYVTQTDSAYFRSGLPARGIEIASESCCKPNPSYQSENIIISNNLVVNTRSALRFWIGDYNNPYRNLKLYYNTFVGSVGDTTINFDSTTTSGNEMRNNIIYGGATMPNASSWTFSNNNWPSGKPSIDNSSTSFSANPLFVSPVVAGPADGYKLQSGSSSIGKGVPVAVTTDYFASTRKALPTIGFYEYTGTVTPTPTPTTSPIPTPTPRSTPNPTVGPTPTPISGPTPTPSPSLSPTPTPTSGPVSTVRYSGVVADAFVSRDNRNTNYGTSQILEIDSDPVKITYLKFDLRNVAGTPKSVKLKYKVANAADAGSGSKQNVKLVSNTSWSETGITYRNRPAASWWPMATINGGGQNTWGSVDLTSGLKGKMGNYVSIAIDSSGSDGFRLDSRESPTTEKPYLEMVF